VDRARETLARLGRQLGPRDPLARQGLDRDGVLRARVARRALGDDRALAQIGGQRQQGRARASSAAARR
jgi:hypothetical protein